MLLDIVQTQVQNKCYGKHFSFICKAIFHSIKYDTKEQNIRKKDHLLNITNDTF